MLEAGCSNGAIYGRFKNKDDILVALYERHNERLRERFTNQQGKNQTRKETLENFFDREIDQLIKMHRENRWLLAAVGTLSRRKPDVVTPEMRTQRKRMFEMIGSQFLRFEDEFETPHLEREIQLIIFFVSTIIREAILHQGPHFGTLKLKDKELKKSLKKMAFGFLGVKD